ncbi:MAG: hypothetical protein ACLQGU_02555 [bacterium]
MDENFHARPLDVSIYVSPVGGLETALKRLQRDWRGSLQRPFTAHTVFSSPSEKRREKHRRSLARLRKVAKKVAWLEAARAGAGNARTVRVRGR